MKNQVIKLFAAIFILLGTAASAQQFIKGQEGMYPSFVSYKENLPAFSRGRIEVRDADGKILTTKNVKLVREETDEQSMTHSRFQQKLNGIPVEHAMWVVHSKNGRITSQNGKLVKTFPQNLKSKPGLNFNAALEKAKEHVNAELYKWEVQAEEEFLQREQGDPSATFFPKKELVYYSGESEVNPASLRLAYKIDIYSQEPLSRKYVFVDAENGSILGERELIHETNANGTAVTVYSGTRNIVSDYTGTNYRLREVNRGSGNGIINTYNLLQGTNYGTAVDFTDADNYWNNVNAQKDEYATDAHLGTEMTYDYYLNTHNRNSIDGAGFPLNSYVHYSTGYFNAFWDGYRMTYGDGNATDNYKPLTSLDVCGHEVTHGVTSYTSNLVYSNESGAMNEAFSDIFGTAIEAYARPANYDWLIGADFYTIRSMSNPNAYSDPDTYVGTNWYTGPGDYGGVHTNSGVLNHWFYLLSVGGGGTNDHGVAFNVTGIGMNSAARIAYKLNTYYLVSTSNYYDARTFGIQSAEDIFGPASNEAIQTANAFTAVGLYAPTCGSVVNPSTTGYTETTATVTWDAIPGAVYYLVEYKTASSPTWISSGASFTNSHTVTGLTATTLYDWRVKSSCSPGYTQSTFTTGSPECNPPSNLLVSVAGTTAYLEWGVPDYAVSFNVQYKPVADSVWIDAGWIADITHTLTGLLNNTQYDWKVLTDCSFDTSDAAYSTFLTDAPSCGAPTGLSVSYSAGLTTTFTWTAAPGAVSYHLQMKWPWDVWGTSEMIDTIVNSNTLVMTGFMSGMTLDWRVRSICNSNISVHAYSSFTTPCPGPSGLTATTVTGNSAVLNWTSGGANSPFGYDVDYKLSTSATWTHSAYVSPTTHTLTGLTQAKTYDARVRQECQVTNSPYIQTQFTTPCSIIPSPTATEVKTNGAKITWSGAAGSTSYTLQYKKSTTGTWTTVSGITNTYYLLTGLTASTIYNYQVKAFCAIGSTAYSPVASFTTYCTSSRQNNQEWIDLFSVGSINRTSGADAGGYVHTGITTNLIAGNANAGIISAGFSGPTKTEIFAVYVDLNKNGSYADAGERLVGPTTFISAGNINFTLTIPTGTATGVTSMRVVMLRQGTSMAPCLTGNRGETEDYFVNVTTGFAIDARSESISQLNSEAETYRAFPNPSDGKFRIECSHCNTIINYQIMSISGAVIESRQVNDVNELDIDISNHAGGIYFLVLNDSEGSPHVLKLVKK